MEEIKRLDRKLIYKGSIIDYYKDEVQIPNGNIDHWDFIDHKGAAAVLAVTNEGKILMVRQYRNALDRYTLEIPAGGLNKGEDMHTAAVRELKEETGYIAGNSSFMLSIRTTVAFCNERIDIFLCTNLTKGEQELDEDEYVDVEEYSLDELIEMISESKIQDSKTVSAIMYYANMVKSK